MKRTLSYLAIVLMVSVVALVPPAGAVPTFQTYISGAAAGDVGSDEESWFSTSDPLTLFIVGAYGPHTISLADVTLFLSVPEGEMGTVHFVDLGDGIPALLTIGGVNPTGSANRNVLTDVLGNDGYAEKDDFAPLTLNNHAPTGDAVSDFVLFDLGSFSDDETPLNNYNAGDGTITSDPAEGEEKRYQLSITGFSRVHFDVYGLVTTKTGRDTHSDWEQNPGSHDATWNPPPPPPPSAIPEPASLLLLGGGMLGTLGIRGRRKFRARS